MQIFLLLIIFICVLVYQWREIRDLERKTLDAFKIVCQKINQERKIKMELVLLTVSICCMVWGIYNYSEVQKLEFKSEKTFLEIARELEILKKEIRSVKK